MELKKVFSELNINDSFYDIISPGWNESLARKPDTLAFLTPDDIRENMDWCSLPKEYFETLKETASGIIASPALSDFAWHCYHQLFANDKIKTFTEWPRNKDMNNELFGKIYLLVSLAMAPKVRIKHHEMGVDENVTRDTCRQVNCFCNNHIQGFKAIGIIPNQLSWLRLYVTGAIFRLGRMEYKLEKVKNFGKVFKNRESGEVVAFAADGIAYNSKGFVDRTDDVANKKHVWVASYSESKNMLKAYPISPYGYAVNKEITLPLNKWECVIKEGDYFLDMHIPSGGGMKPEVCADSMRRAVEFFKKYFPEQKTKAIMSRSWIFNTQFEQELPKSNLTKFMRELYLFPIHSAGRPGFFFIFPAEYDDLSKAPRDTSLQRAMLDIIESGELLRSGGMFILNDDLKHFGKQCYRAQTDKSDLFG